MNCSPATWFAAAKKVVSSFSLLAVLALGAMAVDFGAYQKRIEAHPKLEDRKVILRELLLEPGLDQEFQYRLQEMVDAWDSGGFWDPEPIIEMVALRAVLNSSNAVDPAAKPVAIEIKKNAFYRDSGVDEESNWFARAMGNLGKWISDLLDRLFGNRPNIDPNLSGLNLPNLNWLIYVVYGILAGLLFLFGYLAFRHFKWRGRLQRKATALLDEDEPERSVDEWLQQADMLIAAGKYREAVRCLYLACLLRFDEAGIARFIRSQTNWEHYHRIQSSPSLPAGLDFRPPTASFDRIWYGHRVRGIADTDEFRAWYVQITEAAQKRGAA